MQGLKTLVAVGLVEEYGHQVDVGTLQHHFFHGISQVFWFIDRAEEHDLEKHASVVWKVAEGIWFSKYWVPILHYPVIFTSTVGKFSTPEILIIGVLVSRHFSAPIVSETPGFLIPAFSVFRYTSFRTRHQGCIANLS